MEKPERNKGDNHMNTAEFQAVAIAILGTSIGWQSKIARLLPTRDGKHVTVRQVQRWIAADFIPEWAEKELAQLMGGTERSPFPRDEWLIGDALGADGKVREYIMHMQPPRFIARVVECDDDGNPLPEHEPADILSGTVYAANETTVLCEMLWLDEPRAGEIVQLLEAAADALEEMADAG
ncbi:hypothetical protein ACFPLB_04430 [Aquamicrobium segne]|uniref:Uncharacterized protein n=1 Tax=Aquamicrobium segne TaxID=469547 RepID=A0ABW0GWE5_9HYPH